MPRQTNTKEKIISSAFLMYKKLLFKEFSLGDIAKATGISKTAIFRHFKNKADILSVMNERFFAAFEELAKNLESQSGLHTLEATRRSVDYVFNFARDNPGYVEYYVQALLGKERVAARMVQIMTDSHLYPVQETIFKDEQKLVPENLIPLYIEITILNFLIEAGRAVDNGEVMAEEGEFRRKVTGIIFDGLGRDKNPISPERRHELDSLCTMKLVKDEMGDRFFEAFIRLIKKNTAMNITVEDIATELGISKSSMYAFFVNKMDYMKNMLRKEIDFFSEILQEKCLLANDYDEMIYILIRSEVNYFTERPQVVLMHSFFTYYDTKALDDVTADKDFAFLYKILPPNFDLGFENSKVVFIKWISVLTVTFMFMGEKYDFPTKWVDFFISTLFEFIECGTKSQLRISENVGN